MYKYITEYSELESSLSSIHKNDLIGLDIETTGLDPYTSEILLVQISTPEITYLFDNRLISLLPLFKSLEDYNGTILFFNGEFDTKFCKHFYNWLPKKIFDCFLAEILIYNGLGSQFPSLQELTSKYLKVELNKDIRDSFIDFVGYFTLEQLDYAAKDSEVLLQLYPLLNNALIQRNLKTIADLEFNLVPVVAKMELNGVYLNKEKWIDCYNKSKTLFNETSIQLRESLKQLGSINVEGKSKGQPIIKTIPWDKINFKSPQQMLEVLRSFGLKVSKTDADELSETNHPVANLLLRFKRLARRLDAYGENFFDYINPVTGRTHPNFNQLGAVSGRFSSNEYNAQNIPNPNKDPDKTGINYRLAFEAEEGSKLSIADFSQIELRLAAEVSQDINLLKVFRSNKDPHTNTASLVFGVPYDEIRKESFERTICKNLNFAVLYQSGAWNLARKFEIPEIKAQFIIDGFFKGHPGVYNWIQTSNKMVIANGYSSSILGRKRYFLLPNYADPDLKKKLNAIKREGTNNIIQSSSADMTKLSMLYIDKELDNIGGKMVLTVHDEIVCEIPDNNIEEGQELIRRSMIKAGEEMIKSIPVEVDLHSSKAWEK